MNVEMLNISHNKKMLKKIMIVLLTMLFISTSLTVIIANDGKGSTEQKLNEIEKYLNENYKDLKVPGLSVGILIDGKKNFYNYGHLVSGGNEKVSENTNYEIASLSKAFTGLAITQLNDEGIISIKDNVSKYIKNFHGIIGNEKYEITIKQCLDHTSGISASDLKLIKDDSFNDSLIGTIKSISGIELSNTPGSVFEYSSVNYDILGAVIESATGESFDQYIETRILDNLGMNNSYVGVDQSEKNLAIGHKITFFEPKPYVAPIFTSNVPAGYIVSNTNDMLIWAEAQIEPLENDIIQKAHQPNLSVEPDGNYFYANGWFTKISDKEILSHSGSNPGYESFISIDKTDGIGLIVLGNSNSERLVEMAQNLEIYLDGGVLTPLREKPSGIDFACSLMIIIVSIFLFLEIGFVGKILFDLKKGKRKLRVKNVSLKHLLTYIIFTLPIMYGMYIIPQAFEDSNWYMTNIWMSNTLSTALIYICVVIIFSYFLYFIHMLCPTENEYFRDVPELVVCGVLSGVCNALTILIITNAITGKFNAIYLLYYFALSLGLYISCRKALEVKLAVLTQLIIKNTREKIFNRLFASTYEEFSMIKEGELTAVLTTDINQISEIATLAVTLVTSIITIVASFFYLASISVLATISVLAIIAVVGVIYAYFDGRAINFFEQSRETESVFIEKIEGLIRGFKDISLQNKKKSEYISEVVDVNKDFMSHNVNAFKLFVNAFLLGESFFIIVLGLVAFGFALIFNDSASIFVSMQFVIVLIYLLNPINGILNSIPRIARVRVSINKIQKITEQLITNEVNVDCELKCITDKAIENLLIENTEYMYKSDDSEAFKVGPINLEVSRGEILFIIGGNGSGKSTLIHLITGLFNSSKGRVLVDGDEIVASLRGELISAVFADSYLFSRIYNADLDGKEEMINEYLKEFHLDEKVAIEDGKFTVTKLSTGQKKRLHLLRVILEDKPIIIFDELAADQDPQFRKFFYRDLLPRLKDKGKIIVAVTHDDHYFDIADKVVKMNFGKIEEANFEFSV